MNDNTDWKGFLKTMCLVLPLAIVFTYFMDACSKKNYEEHERTVKYEIEVIDKYDCIGSSWHLVGGRASEQEYHIVYKVKPLTPEAEKEYYGNGEEDDEVPYTLYRKVKIGRKIIGTRYWISGYNF